MKKNILFSLSSEQFDNIVSNDCYICGIKNSTTNKNGVDRLDNNLGYIIENCKSCCSTCNYMKQEYEINLFLKQCSSIYANCSAKMKLSSHQKLFKTKSL